MKKLKQRYSYSVILLKELVKTDFKLRYQGSILGYLWSLIRPLALFAVLYVVFVKFLKVGRGIPHYPMYLLLGIVLWNFFVEVTSGSVAAIVSRGDLLRKINFPKYVIILATSFSALINLAINLIVIGGFMLFNHVSINVGQLWIVPLLIIEIYAFGLAIGFFLSAAFVKFRDIGYIWEVIMQAAFYATPILYPLNIVPVIAQKLLILNPVAQAIQGVRHIIITPKTEVIGTIHHSLSLQIVPYLIVLIVVVISIRYFKNQSRTFAENV